MINNKYIIIYDLNNQIWELCDPNSNVTEVFICYLSTFIALKLFHLTFHTSFKCLKSFSKK